MLPNLVFGDEKLDVQQIVNPQNDRVWNKILEMKSEEWAVVKLPFCYGVSWSNMF